MKSIFTIIFIFISWREIFSQQSVPSRNKDSVATNNRAQTQVYTEGMPSFPGGNDSLNKFIYANLKHDWQQEVTGICYVQFVVRADGTIDRIKILKGVSGCSECDKEAVRVVSLFPKFLPAVVNGKTIDMLFNLPIKFK